MLQLINVKGTTSKPNAEQMAAIRAIGDKVALGILPTVYTTMIGSAQFVFQKVSQTVVRVLMTLGSDTEKFAHFWYGNTNPLEGRYDKYDPYTDEFIVASKPSGIQYYGWYTYDGETTYLDTINAFLNGTQATNYDGYSSYVTGAADNLENYFLTEYASTYFEGIYTAGVSIWGGPMSDTQATYGPGWYKTIPSPTVSIADPSGLSYYRPMKKIETRLDDDTLVGLYIEFVAAEPNIGKIFAKNSAGGFTQKAAIYGDISSYESASCMKQGVYSVGTNMWATEDQMVYQPQYYYRHGVWDPDTGTTWYNRYWYETKFLAIGGAVWDGNGNMWYSGSGEFAVSRKGSYVAFLNVTGIDPTFYTMVFAGGVPQITVIDARTNTVVNTHTCLTCDLSEYPAVNLYDVTETGVAYYRSYSSNRYLGNNFFKIAATDGWSMDFGTDFGYESPVTSDNRFVALTGTSSATRGVYDRQKNAWVRHFDNYLYFNPLTTTL